VRFFGFTRKHSSGLANEATLLDRARKRAMPRKLAAGVERKKNRAVVGVRDMVDKRMVEKDLSCGIGDSGTKGAEVFKI